MLAKHKIQLAIVAFLVLAIIGVIVYTVHKLNVVDNDDLVSQTKMTPQTFKDKLSSETPYSATYLDSVSEVTVYFNGKINYQKLTELKDGTFDKYVAENAHSRLTVKTYGSSSTIDYESGLVDLGENIVINEEVQLPLYLFSDRSLVLGSTLGYEDSYAFIIDVDLNSTFTVNGENLTPRQYIELIAKELYSSIS